MSFRGDDSSIPDRLRVDYAPTGRASCKVCGDLVPQHSVRVGVKVRSPWHDGFDLLWHHPRCALSRGKCPEDFKHWGQLRWADQLALAKQLGFHLDTSRADVQRIADLNRFVWEAHERLSKVPKKILRELLEANGRFLTEKTSPAHMTYTAAEMLVHGVPPVCPWCSCAALVGEGGIVRCSGFSQGTTACGFQLTLVDAFGVNGGAALASEEQRRTVARVRPLALTPAVERVLQGYSAPPGAPVHELGGGTAPEGAATAQGAAGATGKSKGRAKRKVAKAAKTAKTGAMNT